MAYEDYVWRIWEVRNSVAIWVEDGHASSQETSQDAIFAVLAGKLRKEPEWDWRTEDEIREYLLAVSPEPEVYYWCDCAEKGSCGHDGDYTWTFGLGTSWKLRANYHRSDLVTYQDRYEYIRPQRYRI